MYKCQFAYLLTFLLDKYLGIECLDNMTGLHLTFWETAKLSSKAATPFHVSLGECESSASLPTLGVVRLLNLAEIVMCSTISLWF